MPPQNPQPQTSNNGTSNNPYEFMMAQPSQTSKKPGLPNFKGKLAIIVLSLVGLLIVIIIIAVISSMGGDSSNAQLAKIAAQQQEIIRVSDITLKLSKNSKTLATATTVNSSVTSQQKTALELFSKQGGKLEKGQLSLNLSKANDENLNSAAQSNTLEKAYEEYLQANLPIYQKDLQALYLVGGPKTKAFAEQAFNSNDLIYKSL